MSKYLKTDKVENLGAFVARLNLRKPFYFRHKFMAAGFIEHWSFVQVRNAIKAGVLFRAIKIKGPK